MLKKFCVACVVVAVAACGGAGGGISKPDHGFQIVSRVVDELNGELGRTWGSYIVVINGKNYLVGLENSGRRIVLSDEAFWREESPRDQELSDIAAVARHSGLIPGINITPYALRELGGTVSYQELFDQVARVDFFAINPYVFGDAQTDEQLLEFSRISIAHARSVNKKIILIMQGFAVPGTEARVREYNLKLALLDFDELVVADALDWADIPDEWIIDTRDAVELYNSRRR